MKTSDFVQRLLLCICSVSSTLYPFLPFCITYLPLCDPMFHSSILFLVLTSKQSLKEKMVKEEKMKGNVCFKITVHFFFLDHFFLQILEYYLISLLSQVGYCCIQFLFSPANFVSSSCSPMFLGLVFT